MAPARGYFVSVRTASSVIHGQKFCGLRTVDAFLMTVIFMMLLQTLVNGPRDNRCNGTGYYEQDAAVRCAKLVRADSIAPL